MSKEESLLEYWRELPSEDQDKVLEFVRALKQEASNPEFMPQTPLGKKLWEIRQRAIANGMKLLTEKELELELSERRGGYREP